MIDSLLNKTISEPERQTPVIYEADVVVVGGGPGGHSAAVAAARSGARTVLVERYGHLGGMTTGGLVTVLHSLTDGTSRQIIGGLCREWIDRLDALGATEHPAWEEAGSSDEKLLERWRGFRFAVKKRLIFGARFDPEILKCILSEIAVGAGVKLLLHAWCTQTIVENGAVKGVIVESKSGRQAILAGVVVDGSGDGDLMASAGASFTTNMDRGTRIGKAALCFELGNVDKQEDAAFRRAEPARHAELMQALTRQGGFTMGLDSTRPGVVHFNMFLTGYDVLKAEDLTRIEVDARRRMLLTWDYFKKNVPGFARSFVMLTAPQVGVRGSRRLIGEYVLKERDALAGTLFKDTIAVFKPLRGVAPEDPHVRVPYRCLVPKEVDGLLVAGRCFSSDEVMNEHCNPIAQCVALGQAAGTAAALAVKSGLQPRSVSIDLLQDRLREQGVVLPGSNGI